MSNSQQLISNLKQQTKRLLDQLKQLEENKADLEEQEYNELKKQTIEELNTFQKSLNSMLKDPNNSLLQLQIEKTKRQIFQAFRHQYNKEQIVDRLLQEQVRGTRNHIKDLEDRYHLKKMNEVDYVSKKRKMIVEMEEMGAKLTPQERQWLALNSHFAEKGSEDVKEEIQKNQMKLVQKKIQDKI